MLSMLTYYPEKTSIYLVALVQQYYTPCRKLTTLTAATMYNTAVTDLNLNS